MENKKSFIAYTDWKDTFDALPDVKAGQLIKYIFAYVNDDNPETKDVLINAVFANIKQTLKRDLKKWDTQQKQRIAAGIKSAELRKRALTTAEQSSTVSVSGNDSVSDTVNEKKQLKSVKRFTPPALLEVFNYMVEKGLHPAEATVQSDKFINHYTSNGWKVGKNKMIDWAAAVRSNWLKDINSNGQSEYSYDEVVRIHNDSKDQRLMNNFECIGNKIWKLK